MIHLDIAFVVPYQPELYSIKLRLLCFSVPVVKLLMKFVLVIQKIGRTTLKVVVGLGLKSRSL
jgi:hypothetical protein